MRTHIQGVFLLCLLAAALWGMTRLASPALTEAFGEDGALRADSGEDLIELTVDGNRIDEPLTGDEMTRLQFLLLLGGYLTRQSDVDGVPGPTTEAAIAAAAAEWDLVEPTDRQVLIHADEFYADVPFFDET